MKIFLSFRFTGEDPAILEQTNKKVAQALVAAGHEVYNSLDQQEHFRQNVFTNRQIMNHTFNELDKCDAILAYILSDKRSEGMLMELGYAFAKAKRIIVAVKKGVNTYTTQMANDVIEFEIPEELYQTLEQLK